MILENGGLLSGNTVTLLQELVMTSVPFVFVFYDLISRGIPSSKADITQATVKARLRLVTLK